MWLILSLSPSLPLWGLFLSLSLTRWWQLNDSSKMEARVLFH